MPPTGSAHSESLRYFGLNTSGRDYVVGDIHGCFHLLDALLERIGFDRDRDRLFSVGDLIDRGPASERALEFIAYPWFHAIRGNHEQMLLDGLARHGQALTLWQSNGGDWFTGVAQDEYATWIEQFQALPLAAEVVMQDGGRAGLAHADCPDDWGTVQSGLVCGGVGNRLSETLLWSRQRAGDVERLAGGRSAWWTRRPSVAVAGIDLVFFGHTPIPEPIACANTRWLDTGAFMGGRLTVAELAVDGRVWSLSADRDDCRTEWRGVDR